MKDIKQRIIGGIVALTGRGLLLRLLSFLSLGILGALLTESEFGVYFIVAAVVNFLTYFSDIGLAASLVQKKGKVTQTELRTTFTIQQILVVTLLVVLYIFSPKIKQVYALTDDAMFLLASLSFSFLLSSLKTIPSVLMERSLEFNKWIIPQLVEDVVYNFAVVIFAFMGHGVNSFSWAIILRSIVGISVVYLIKPWVPGFSLSISSIRELFKFGIPYQINTLLAVLKDDGATLVLGKILGANSIGFLGWAQKWIQVPLRLFMDTVTKVSFPAFSRLQSSKKDLETAVTKSVFFICFLVFPSVIAICILAPEIIEIVPRYEKWRPALIPLYILATNVLLAAATTQMTNLLNAIGKIKLTFKLMVMWTILTWLFIPYFSIKYGLNGAALGYLLVGLSSILAIYLTKRIVNFSLGESVLKPLFSALFMGILMYIILLSFETGILALIVTTILGGVFYVVFMTFISNSFIGDVKKILNEIAKKN